MPLFCCEVILNYYERHLGDYAKDTAHLSMMEHGAYNLLLDRYYATEQGIPDSNVFRIARARTKEEKNAVKTVLSEFFELIEGVWINHRSEEEISKAHIKIDAARINGKKGGRPMKQRVKKPSGFSVGYESETQQKAHQTPDTRHQNNLPTVVINEMPPSHEGQLVVDGDTGEVLWAQ